MWHPIEYINRHWYWIKFKEGFWWTCEKGKVKTPQKYGLGVKAHPYIDSPDQRRIELAGIYSDKESEAKTCTEVSEVDKPTND